MTSNTGNWNSLVLSVKKLDDTNYNDWKFAISMVLRRANLWELATSSTPPDSTKESKNKNEELLTIIGLTVDPSQYQHINSCADGYSAWKALASIYESHSRANRIALKQEFYGAIHNPQQPIDSYIRTISDLANRLKLINVKLEENDIIDVLIFNLSNTWSDFAGTLAATQDDQADFKTVADLLRAEDLRRRRLNILSPEATEEIKDVALNARLTKKVRNSLALRNALGIPLPERRSSTTCYRCGKIGHIAKDCRAPAPLDQQEQSNFVSEETPFEIAY